MESEEKESLLKTILLILPLCLCLSSMLCAGEKAPNAQDAAPTAEAPPSVPARGSTVKAAEAVEQTYFDEFVDKVKKGGATMVFLLLLSIAGITYILERVANLRSRTFATPGLVEKSSELFQKNQFEKLEELCRKDKSILGRIVLAVVDHRECETSDIQSIADDIGSREIRCQMQKAYPLAIIATLSPLLGLFGTVIGMIGAFDTVSAVGEMGNASIMAGDIAKALVTTAGGLVVAMPMLGFYHFFRSRTNRYAIALEEDTSELFSAWFLKKKVQKA